MVNYSCEKCGKTFKQKGHYTKHLQRKTPCDNIKDKIKQIVEEKINEVVEEKIQELVQKGHIKDIKDIEIKNKNLISNNKNSNINNTEMGDKQFKIAETFVGCGGAHLGFKNNGFTTSFLNDIWDESIITLRQNFKKLKDNQVYLCDIKEITKEKLLQNNTDIKDLDVLFGGVVCCGFSMAGNRNPFDERNYLYIEQMRLVKELNPKVSIIENVKGFMSMKLVEKKDQTEEIVSKYKDLLKVNKSLNGKKSARRKANKTYEDITQKVKDNDIKMKEIIKDIEKKQYNVLDRIKNTYKELGYNVYC